jgi:hypothetical protein
MNTFMWVAIAFALAGILAFIGGNFWGTRRNTNSGDFGPVVAGLILLVVSEVIAVVLAIIGFVLKSV